MVNPALRVLNEGFATFDGFLLRKENDRYEMVDPIDYDIQLGGTTPNTTIRKDRNIVLTAKHSEPGSFNQHHRTNQFNHVNHLNQPYNLQQLNHMNPVLTNHAVPKTPTNQTNPIQQIKVPNNIRFSPLPGNTNSFSSINNTFNYAGTTPPFNAYNNPVGIHASGSNFFSLNQSNNVSHSSYRNDTYNHNKNYLIVVNNSTPNFTNISENPPIQPLHRANSSTYPSSVNRASPLHPMVPSPTQLHPISYFNNMNLPNPIRPMGSSGAIGPISTGNQPFQISSLDPTKPLNLNNPITNPQGSPTSLNIINNPINQRNPVPSISTSPIETNNLVDFAKLFDMYPQTNCIFYPHEKLFNLVNLIPKKIVLYDNTCEIIPDNAKADASGNYVCDMQVICLHSSKYLKSKYLIQSGQMEIIKLCKDYENDIPLLGGILKTEAFHFSGPDIKILNNFKVHEHEINKISEKLIIKYSGDLSEQMKLNPEITEFFTKASRILTVKEVDNNTLSRYSRSFAKMLYIMHNISNFSFVDEHLKVTREIDFPLELNSNQINFLELAFEDLIFKLLTRSDLIPLWYKLLTVCCFQFNKKKSGAYKLITPIILRDLIFCLRQWCKYAFLHNYCNNKMTFEDIKHYFSEENKFSVWMWLKNISNAAIKDYKVYRNPMLKRSTADGLNDNDHYLTIDFIQTFYNFVKNEFDNNVTFLSNLFESGLLEIEQLGKQLLSDDNMSLSSDMKKPLSSLWEKSVINEVVPKGKKYDKSFELATEKVNQCIIHIAWMVFLSVGGLIDLDDFSKIKVLGGDKNISIDPNSKCFYIVMEQSQTKKQTVTKHILDNCTTLYLLYYYVVLRPILLDQISAKCTHDIFHESFVEYNIKANGELEPASHRLDISKSTEFFLIFESSNLIPINKSHVQSLYDAFLKTNESQPKFVLTDFIHNLESIKNQYSIKNPESNLMEVLRSANH